MTKKTTMRDTAKLVSYANILWARHGISLPHERLLKPRAHALPFLFLPYRVAVTRKMLSVS